MHNTPKWLSAALILGAAGCVSEAAPLSGTAAAERRSSPTDALYLSLPPARMLPAGENERRIESAVDTHFNQQPSRRGYLMTDKPLYQPGETIWFRANLRQTATLAPIGPTGALVQLVSPRGAVVAQKRVRVVDSVAKNDFEIPAEAEGGEFTLKLTADDGSSDEKKLIVNTYEAPRLQKTLEFVRKAYGPGDSVAAALEIKRPTGEPFAAKAVTATVTVDDVEVASVPVTTDAAGKATVRFTLPASIARGDGLLTVLAPDGGVTESIQKRIPILLHSVDVSLFPEGGDLIEGLPGRVYLAAKNTLGKPADVAGRVVDDRGAEIATFRSLHDGMARFELLPAAGRSYRVEITEPAGIAQTFTVPTAKPAGCVLRSLDDGSGAQAALELAAVCSDKRTLTALATLRERRVAGGALEVEARQPARLSLPVEAGAQGAVRVTLFDEHDNPLAERLIYRGRGRDLKVSISADKKSYTPRDPVTLTVKAEDPSGKPVAASLGLAVVDDTVLSYADDKSARILAHLFLEPELPGKVEEPNFYFGDKPEAGAALDLLLGTAGYRRFDWQLVFAPPPPAEAVGMDEDVRLEGALVRPDGEMVKEKAQAERPMRGEHRPMAPKVAAGPMPVNAAPPPPPAAKAAKGEPGARPMIVAAQQPAAEPPADKPAHANAMGRKDRDIAKGMGEGFARGGGAMGVMGKAEAWDQREGEMARRPAWAPVRVFPVPKYEPGYDGPRTDFRETVFWAPDVRTGADGTAKVTFALSDAVTSFRATAEGLSAGGFPGRGEAVIQSKLPLSLDAHLPLEVSAGDTLSLPVTLTNETDREVAATLDAFFGASFKLGERPQSGDIHLGPGEKKTFFYPLEVVGKEGESEVQIALATQGLKDEIKKKIRVVPVGFPFEVSRSGTLAGRASHELSLAGALPGSIHAEVMLYPSPLATMTQGLQGMIREPGGCFEQTSSSNYPNVMIMSYLGANDSADAELAQKTQGVLDKGYKILTGYETQSKGYEWFGHTPGHEALTAYGLMEFEDMGRVYDVDKGMVERTAAWLMSRRDGKGGFQRSSEALDSFGRASPATTDAYIVWALSEAKRVRDLGPELAAQRQRGLDSSDPYIVALAANTFLNTAPGGDDARAIVKRLAGLQKADGSFTGAKETITMSGGEALTIETTALATLAFVKASPAGEHEGELRKSVEWLNGHRGGYGEWGSTQSTILSLKALTAYADHSRATASDGTVTLVVNGKEVGRQHFEKGRRGAITFDDVDAALTAGDNAIELRLDGQSRLPYTIAVSYRSARPQSSEQAKVAVTTELAKTTVAMGAGVKMRAHVENKTEGGVPMTLARVGIPGGLVYQTWQLKELRDKGLIDFYETRPREVILYWRALAPRAQKDVDLDLLAAVPGHYTAPATSAYLYYTNEDKSWAAPPSITVER
jgi:hypothetical protein